MLATSLGIILLLIPFLLIFCFNNRWQGFLYILSLTVFWHLLLALISQYFHIFNYQLILSANSLFALVSLGILIKKTNKDSFKLKFNYFGLLAFLIIFFELWSVHFFYSGPVNTVRGPIEKTHFSSSYPYFSDEWVGASLIKSAIDNKSLPSGNPLSEPGRYNHFSNILVCFFALVSEIVLLLSLNPLTAYPVLAISAGFLICFLVFSFLKINKLKDIPAILGSLLIPLIVNGSNLPALWYFIPFTGGLIFFLVGLSALALKDWKLFFFSSLITLLLYPPMIVFIFGAYIAAALSEKKIKDGLKFGLIGLILFIVSGMIIITLQKPALSSLISIIKKTIFYSSLDPGIASYPIWIIMPLVILPFSLFGVYRLLKDRKYYLLTPIIIGLSFWAFYSQTINFFIISYERTVVVTACLLISSAAFAFDYLLDELSKNFPTLKELNSQLIIKVGILFLFCIIAWSYTINNNWQKLTLTISNSAGLQFLKPNPPVNQYLNEDDLKIFQSLKNKKFLSLPWKSLVIGVATNNYPLDSKPSFITNHFLDYKVFMAQDCKNKVEMAKKYRIEYVYSPAFSCDNFIDLAASPEELHLYQFKP